MRRVNVSSVRDSLNGYQKGKCFYSMLDISINPLTGSMCHVDHFLPHANKLEHERHGANINGVWNLVLLDSKIHEDKGTKIPEVRFLERLYKRNEYYIESKHPLAETIINQTGSTSTDRQRFLELQYNVALRCSIHRWRPKLEFIEVHL